MLTPEQYSAAVVAVSKQLETIGAALEAAHASLAVLALDAGDEPDTDAPVATDDPSTCGHPDDDVDDILGQKICNSCGLNLTVPCLVSPTSVTDVTMSTSADNE